MNTEKAREILSSVDFDNIDPHDEEVRQAIHLATQDKELMRWVDEQQQKDPLIREALEGVPVPQTLQKDLLSSIDAVRNGPRNAFGKWRWIYGIAAMAAIAFVSIFLYRNDFIIQSIQKQVTGQDQNAFPTFREGMAYYIAKVYFQLDHLTSDLDSIEDWLNERRVPAYEDLPAELVALNPIGCKELSWRGEPVTLVCFHTDKGGIIHLFIMEKEGIDPSTYDSIQSVSMSQGLETGGWTTDSRVYVLVGSGPDVDIEFALG